MQPPTDPIAAVTHPDPYPYYAALTETHPFRFDPALALWVAADAEAVTAVLASEHLRVRPPAEPVPRALQGKPLGDIFARLVRMTDGAEQPAMKQAVTAALAGLQPDRIAGLARDIAAELWPSEGAAAGSKDLTPFAFGLPTGVVASALGVPAPRRAQTTLDVGDVAAAFAPGASGAAIAAGNAAAERMLSPGRVLASEDAAAETALLPALARAARQAGISDAQRAIANGLGLLTQTYDATAGLIGNTLLALAPRPALWERATEDEAFLRDVVREVLRFDPPIQNTRRFVANDCEVAQQRLHKGDSILVLLAAANRDPHANPEPHRFDPQRAGARLFTFGHGVHACPGEALACTLTTAGVGHLLRCGLDLDVLARPAPYRPSANARIPLLAVRETAATHP